jgi:hypothetical protein
MGILEWLGEPGNPGPVGGVGFGRRTPGRRKRWVVLVRGGVAIAALAFLLERAWPPEGFSALPLCVAVGAYLVVAYLCHPEPDTSNLGWFGGLIDHPLRWSDDVNRFLLFLLLVLWPGRFVAESMVELARLGWELATGA